MSFLKLLSDVTIFIETTLLIPWMILKTLTAYYGNLLVVLFTLLIPWLILKKLTAYY